MDSCANCAQKFKEKSRHSGYYRFSLEKNIPNSDICARDQLEKLCNVPYTPVPKKRGGQFLCPVCWGKICDIYNYRRSIDEFWTRGASGTYITQKKSQETSARVFESTQEKFEETISKVLESTPKQESSGVRKPLFPKTAKKSSKWDSIANNIKKRKYSAAIRGIYNATQGTKRHFHRVVGNIVRKEIKELLASDFALCHEPSLDNISNFSWNSALKQFEDIAPLSFTVLKSIMTKPSEENNLVRGEKRSLKPAFGLALSTLLYTKAPRKAKLIPTAYSIELWRGGLKRETLKQLSHSSMCLGYKGTVSAIDKIRQSFDVAGKSAKHLLELQLSEGEIRNPALSNNEELELSVALSELFPNIEDEINEEVMSDSDETIMYETCEMMEEVSSSEDEDAGVEQDDDSTGEEEEEEEEATYAEISGIEERLEGTELEMETHVEEEQIEEMELAEPVMSPGHQTSSMLERETLHPGYTFCWDNVGKKVVTRHPSPDTQNTYINMALGYMAMNRVPVTHLDISQTINAVDIHPSIFVPNEEDFNELQFRMEVIISRIITRHLNWFRDNFSDCRVPHILHAHSNEMSKKSLLVNLGVFEENPSSTQGAIGIYRKLLEYVASVDGKPFPSVVFGDGLSCERGSDAKRAVCNGLDPWERLEGLEPSPQEFHKEMILLQDFYDEFFKGASAAERGTLFNLKNIFNFRQVKGDTSTCFSDAWELMCLTTEAFVCLLAMQMLGMDSADEIPNNIPANFGNMSHEEKSEYLKTTSDLIREALEFKLDTDLLLKMDKDPGKEVLYCCDKDITEDFIGCGLGDRCAKGQWFHYSCACLDPSSLPSEFFCSDECRARSEVSYPYCICKRDLGEFEPMIGCDALDDCVGGEWFHMSCLGLVEPPDGDWFCCTNCESMKSKQKKRKRKKPNKPSEDFRYNYNIAITWCGLNLLCRRDAVREGDGEAMLRYWRLDLSNFFSKRHPKYVILAHRLLCATNGWLPQKMQEEITWNRTVNYSGGMGRNLPMDFMNEIFNRLYKDLLEGAKGRYTSETLQRCGQMVGPLSEALDTMFDENIVENALYKHRRRDYNRDNNVQRVINMLKIERPFFRDVGSSFKSFPAFVHTENPKLAGKFLHKIRQLSEKLDKRRRNVINQ